MRILLAVDRSPYSEEAVGSIAARPWPQDTLVRVLHVIQVYAALPPVVDFVSGVAAPSEMEGQSRKDAEDLVSSIAKRLRAAGLQAETAVVQGDPRAAILDDAASWSADLIVLGSHGYTGITRLLLGSVAQSVVAHAPCSVEVVRTKVAAPS